MEILLLGTGAADGWPNPWCRCASCSWARRTGTVRTTTAALVDGVLLLDCGPDAPRQADRGGAGLAAVRAVVLTHAHPDHTAPEALLARSWAACEGPLRVLGPAAALDLCRDWIGPDDDVRLEPVVAGDVVEVDGYLVRVLAAAHDDGTDPLSRDAVLVDVTGPDGARLLYATDTGPVGHATLEAMRGAAYDVALVEETFGTVADHGTGHLDLTTFPRELARWREVGAVHEGTDVVAVHLGHRNPPGPELARQLASWGARAVPDGTRLTAGRGEGALDAPVSGGRRCLLVGGARSGKSREAERRLLAEPLVRYVATSGSRPGDDEWAARVALHRARRPAEWTTEETLEVAELLERADECSPPVLVDCLALWLAGRLDRAGVWATEPGSAAYADAVATVERDVDALVGAVRGTQARVVLVSNEVGSGVVPEHASGRLYRDLLGTLNARVAAECDEVLLVVAGRVVPL